MLWAASTLLFLWLGTLADRWLGTEPALTFIGAFLGAGAGFYYMYRQLSDVGKPGRRVEKARGREGEK
jgi:F0F1-type ATP synthase assembly protein I